MAVAQKGWASSRPAGPGNDENQGEPSAINNNGSTSSMDDDWLSLGEDNDFILVTNDEADHASDIGKWLI